MQEKTKTKALHKVVEMFVVAEAWELCGGLGGDIIMQIHYEVYRTFRRVCGSSGRKSIKGEIQLFYNMNAFHSNPEHLPVLSLAVREAQGPAAPEKRGQQPGRSISPRLSASGHREHHRLLWTKI